MQPARADVARPVSVLRRSIAIVIGPTPPGTGVMEPGDLDDGRIDVAHELALRRCG